MLISENNTGIENNKDDTIGQIARKACNYARSFILKGSSQLDNNTLSPPYFDSLNNAIFHLRAFYTELTPKYIFEVDSTISSFLGKIKTSKKFSLGNCYELAHMGLDYILRFTPTHISAEVYMIEGGDHVFLVIGRKKDSSPNDPDTWGEEAYICDPWSDKVYPASQYQLELKNYERKTEKVIVPSSTTTVAYECDRQSNCIESFDTKKHRLSPIPKANTINLRSINSQITGNYNNKMNLIIAALEKLEQGLVDIATRLDKKFFDEDDKKIIITNMARRLRTAIADIRSEMLDNRLDYDAFLETLNQSLKKAIRSYGQACALSEEEHTSIIRKSLKEKALTFFKIPTATTVDAINHGIKTTNEQIKDIIKLPKH